MRKPKNRWRLAVQVVFFVLVAAISINHTLGEAGASIPVLSSASLHAICPFGGVVSIYQVATAGTYVQKVHAASFILMAIGFLVALLFGPAFCGWLCPMGSIQEWFGKLGRKILGRRYNRIIPAKVDRRLRYLRYAVLAWVLYMTAVTGKLIFADYDPYFALFNLWSSELAHRRHHRPRGHARCLARRRAAVLQVRLPVRSGARDLQPVPGLRHPAQSADLHELQSLRPGLPDEHPGIDQTRPGARPPVHHLPGVHVRECLPQKDTVILGIGAPAGPAAAGPAPAKEVTT